MEYARICLPCIVQLNAYENTVKMDEPDQSYTELPDSTHKMLFFKSGGGADLSKHRKTALVGIGEKENKNCFLAWIKLGKLKGFRDVFCPEKYSMVNNHMHFTHWG